VINKNSKRRERWEVLFQVVGIYENSARVAAIIMIVATAPPSAVTDHDNAGEL
jgi:hypothetical protein